MTHWPWSATWQSLRSLEQHSCSGNLYELVNSELSYSLSDHLWEYRVDWGSHCKSHHLTGTCTTVTNETHSLFWKVGAFPHLLGPTCAFYCLSHINTTPMVRQRLLLMCSPSLSWGDSDLSLLWQNQGWFSPCSSRTLTGSQLFPRNYKGLNQKSHCWQNVFFRQWQTWKGCQWLSS